MHLNQVTLPVNDMEKTSVFYRRLGFLQIVDSPHYARFEDATGSATFSLSLDPDSLSGVTKGGENGSGNGAVIYFEAENLDQLVEKLLAKGIEFATVPQDQKWLWREASLFDPSGNKIKFYFAGEARRYPPWRVEKKDDQ